MLVSMLNLQHNQTYNHSLCHPKKLLLFRRKSLSLKKRLLMRLWLEWNNNVARMEKMGFSLILL